METPVAGLLSLTDELLSKVLLAAGAPAVARVATLCRRLRAVQQQLAALPAFASAACMLEQDAALVDMIRTAVTAAREQMPAAIHFCLVFVAGVIKTRGKADGTSDSMEQVVPLCQKLLPPGTQVMGCCGRGLFGVEAGVPLEIDPAHTHMKGASVLLGCLPGCNVRAFAANRCPVDGWASEASCRAWLGLDSGLEDAVEPLSCLLFAHSAVGNDLTDCLDGLHAAFPRLVVTGGISSGAANLFCSAAHFEAGEGGSLSPGGKAQRAKGDTKARYVGLLVCRQPSSSKDNFYGAGLSAQGMQGMPPLLSQLQIIRNFGSLQHPTSNGEPHETELLGITSALTVGGQDGMHHLRRLANNQVEIGVWAASSADPGSFEAEVAAGRPVAVLQMYGTVEDAEALAAALDDVAFAAVMEAAKEDGRVLCTQPLRLSAQGAKEALRLGVGRLAGGRPASHPLLPTSNMGLILVSCTAKGKQMHGATSVEAKLVHEASSGLPLAGVYCDGEIGPQILNGKSALQSADSPAVQPVGRPCPCSRLQGFTTIVTAFGAAAQ